MNLARPLRPAALTTVVVTTALVVVAAPAYAAQSNFVSGTVNPNGTYGRLDTLRHVTTPDDTIIFNPTNLTSGGTSIYLVSGTTSARFSNIVSYTAINSAKTLATHVLDGTTFYVYAKKINAGGSDNYFDGNMWY